MGCPGCPLSAKEQQRILDNKIKLAQQDAVKFQKTMVLYYLADGSIDYMEQSAAELNGYSAFRYISHMQSVNNG